MAATTSTAIQERRLDRNDLERRLCHALDIAHQAVLRLAVNGYTDAEEPSNNIRPEKVITETALLLYVTSKAAQLEAVQTRIRRLTELLITYARSDRMLLGVCLEPALAWDFAQAHVLLRKLGYPDADFDVVLSQAAHSQVSAGRERTPYRMLEQEWIRALWNNAQPGRHSRLRSLASSSALGKSIDLLSGSREDIYAFTHALMYVTDFNINPQRLPRPRRAILAEAEVALAFCLDEQDYDLGGEVLLAWPLTGKSWSAAASFGFRVLASVEDKAGFLPTPGTRLDRLGKLEGDARAEYLLATAYHTAYVMGLLCAAALDSERTPPAKIRTAGAVRGSADMFLPFLDAQERNPHWRDELNLLNDRERDAIAGLLLSMALRQKTKQRDFAAVHQLLSIGYSLGLANNPVSSQAAEMLERVATFAKREAAKV
jgi:hypothetical protein